MVATSQIRITNKSKEKKEVNFSDILKEKDLSSDSVLYNFESGTIASDLDNDFFHMKINSVDVFKAIDKILKPNLDIKDYKSKFTNNSVDISCRGKQSQIKLILNPISHIVIRLVYQKK